MFVFLKIGCNETLFPIKSAFYRKSKEDKTEANYLNENEVLVLHIFEMLILIIISFSTFKQEN